MPLALSSFFLSTNKAFTLERHYNQRRIRSLNDRLKVFNSQGDPNFEKSAKEFAERIRRSSSNAFKSLKDKARDFDKKNDVRRKAKQLLNSAVEQYEVLEFKAKRRGSKFLRENKLDEKFDQASRSMRETIEDIDYKFRIKQRTSVAVEDFQRNWPRVNFAFNYSCNSFSIHSLFRFFLQYRRSIDSFLATPLGSVVQVSKKFPLSSYFLFFTF